ncbi:serine/threonine-protein phosphatase [Actinomadura sp. ATCC 31491]|uniref:Serine/threonine-protein phosphatase n=1 Tax=Actinomadura luzonensis TaxID=2805427 RepID=A0ABT0FVX3_9ACTN|nr:PP2C family protein-serine/threonine phosphatase [Actinomadura luzonensis]MCK2216492.1 serine/threonine-protein phosphatase [Actinomadura luzonensis]
MTGLTSSLGQDKTGAVWRGAPHPVLVVDAAGVIAQANDVALRLLPAAAPGASLADAAPAWLSQAHDQALTAGAAHPANGTRPAGGTPPANGTRPDGVVRGPVGEATFEARPARDGDLVAWWLSDVTDLERATRALRVERERTAFLDTASSELLSSLNLDRCMEVTARLAARHLADAALVILPPHRRRHPIAYCGPDGVVVREELAVDPETVPGLAEALQGYPPLPSRWIDPAAAPGWLARDGLGAVGSMVVSALPGHGVPAGALVLLRGGGQSCFSDGEEVIARLFAARAGAAMSAARLYAEQAGITETLMRELLPPRVRSLEGVELAARYRPSEHTARVGGDFYDLHPSAEPGQESLVVLGDVAGKGLEAAVLTGKIRHTLQALLPLADDHQRVLELLNGVLLKSGERTRFVTLVLASIRRAGGRVRLRLTSAGHAPPLIVRGDGRVEAASTRGTLIGMLERVTSVTDTVTLEPGETCLLFTDGITEAMGGPLGDEMFGEERLLEDLRQCGGMPPEAIAERVEMLASQWVGGGDHDDMAVIAITAPRGAHLSAVGGLGRGRFTA